MIILTTISWYTYLFRSKNERVLSKRLWIHLLYLNSSSSGCVVIWGYMYTEFLRVDICQASFSFIRLFAFQESWCVTFEAHKKVTKENLNK